MKALRIHLKQTSANYRREETIDNKMTYPLPPFSTIIGAIHSACGFKEYVPLELSVQGKYKTLGKEAYTDYCFLNSLQDDRNIMVKMYNPDNLSKGYTRVAKALKAQGNSFRKDITIMVENQELIDEYRKLKDINDEISDFKKNRLARTNSLIKQRKKTLSEKKKQFDKKSSEYKLLADREKQIKELEKKIKEGISRYEEENYKIPISYFRTLTTSLKYYEVLYDIELFIHIKANDEILNHILSNVYNIKSLGRSEDFVDVLSAEIVEIEEPDDEYTSEYHAYVDAGLIDKKEPDIIADKSNKNIAAQGTKYYINKNYYFEDERKIKRIFEKKKVYYISKFSIDEESCGVYVDKTDGMNLIVNFI